MLENVPCVLQKNVYFAVVGRTLLSISIRSNCFTGLLTFISLLILYLVAPTMREGILKTPITAVELLISLSSILSVWLHIFWGLAVGVCVYNCHIFLMINGFIIITSFFSLRTLIFFPWRYILSDISKTYSNPFMGIIDMNYLSPSFHFQSLLRESKMQLLLTTHDWI